MTIPITFRMGLLGGLLGAVGLLFAQFSAPTAPADPLPQDRKINLALRRTADHLLRAAGDSTSRIPAVQQPAPHTFRIQLGRAFDYDQLPRILQESLRLHRINTPYDVAVIDCATGKVQLGYSINDLMGSQPIPCRGRSLSAGCYLVQLTFEGSAPTPQPVRPFWPALAAGGLVVLGWLVWTRRKPIPEPVEVSSSPGPPLLHFGRSALDMANQTLQCGSRQHALTYREAKLLRLLVSHPNQVLEREQILKQVWEDEGVTVGRSVDVFVSRLRKLLHDDPTLRIAAVHGVGYRLEVQEPVDR